MASSAAVVSVSEKKKPKQRPKERKRGSPATTTSDILELAKWLDAELDLRWGVDSSGRRYESVAAWWEWCGKRAVKRARRATASSSSAASTSASASTGAGGGAGVSSSRAAASDKRQSWWYSGGAQYWEVCNVQQSGRAKGRCGQLQHCTSPSPTNGKPHPETPSATPHPTPSPRASMCQLP